MSIVQYSIKDLENFTGIKAHTIRIWEQRYSMLQPRRSDTNIRYYDESDLKKIMNINLIYNSGLKISKIALLNEQEIIEKAKELISSEENSTVLLDNFIVMILKFDETKLIELLETEIRVKGIIKMYTNVILPLLSKLGVLWQVDTIKIVHEHFFSKIFKDLIIREINLLPTNSESINSAVLFLNEHEEHEFSLLMYNYILRSEGFKVYYFGQKIPLSEIDFVIDLLKPKLVVTTFTSKISKTRYQRIIDILAEMATKTSIIVSGFQVSYQQYEIPGSITNVDSIQKLYDKLELLKT